MINIISLFVSIIALVVSIVAFGYTFMTEIVNLKVSKPTYYDYGSANKTELIFYITNRSNSNITVEKVEYYQDDNILPKGAYSLPTAISLNEDIVINPGGKYLFGNSIPLKSRPDKLVIRFDHRVSLFSKTLTVIFNEKDNVKDA